MEGKEFQEGIDKAITDAAEEKRQKDQAHREHLVNELLYLVTNEAAKEIMNAAEAKKEIYIARVAKNQVLNRALAGLVDVMSILDEDIDGLRADGNCRVLYRNIKAAIEAMIMRHGFDIFLGNFTNLIRR